MIKVKNKRVHRKTNYDVDISYPSILANPYTAPDQKLVAHGPEDAQIKFRNYLIQKLKEKEPHITKEFTKILKSHMAGKEVNLVCFCGGEFCHGHVIKKLALMYESKMRRK